MRTETVSHCAGEGELPVLVCLPRMNMNRAEVTSHQNTANKLEASSLTSRIIQYFYREIIKHATSNISREAPWLQSDNPRLARFSFISLQHAFFYVQCWFFGSHYASPWPFPFVAQQQYLNQVAAKQTPATPPSLSAVQGLFPLQFWTLLFNKTTITVGTTPDLEKGSKFSASQW